MEAYLHKVQYYETDRMGIVHHSNYIRWMEEARIGFLSQIGWDYKTLEDMGIVSPVTAVECRYKTAAIFGDTVAIMVQVEEFRGVRLKLNYTMSRKDGALVCAGHTEHCFLNTEGKIISLKREYPELYQAMAELSV